MSLESEDHEMLVKELRGMDREELKATIDYWENEAVWSHQLQMLDMVKQELKQRDKERQEQIERTQGRSHSYAHDTPSLRQSDVLARSAQYRQGLRAP